MRKTQYQRYQDLMPPEFDNRVYCYQCKKETKCKFKGAQLLPKRCKYIVFTDQAIAEVIDIKKLVKSGFFEKGKLSHDRA